MLLGVSWCPLHHDGGARLEPQSPSCQGVLSSTGWLEFITFCSGPLPGDGFPRWWETCPADTSTELLQATLLSTACSLSHHVSQARVWRHHKPSVSPSPTCHMPELLGHVQPAKASQRLAVPSGACKLESGLEKDCSPKSAAVLRHRLGPGLQGDTQGRLRSGVGS